MSHSAKLNSIQIAWLNSVRKAGGRVSIYFCNGDHIHNAVVTRFDWHTIEIRVGKDVQLVSKTNVLTIIPDQRIRKANQLIIDVKPVRNFIEQPKDPVVTVKRRRLTHGTDDNINQK